MSDRGRTKDVCLEGACGLGKVNHDGREISPDILSGLTLQVNLRSIVLLLACFELLKFSPGTVHRMLGKHLPGAVFLRGINGLRSE